MIDKRLLQLAHYCRSIGYLRSLTTGAVRVDFDGASGTLTIKERKSSMTLYLGGSHTSGNFSAAGGTGCGTAGHRSPARAHQGPCMDGARGARGIWHIGEAFGCSMYPAFECRRFGRWPWCDPLIGPNQNHELFLRVSAHFVSLCITDGTSVRLQEAAAQQG
jgi:hypothetical protein